VFRLAPSFDQNRTLDKGFSDQFAEQSDLATSRIVKIGDLATTFIKDSSPALRLLLEVSL
jgi:hypothetical protein